MKVKIIKLSFVIVFLMLLKILLINNFLVPKEFYWDKFSNWKTRDYLLEWEYGCKIVEIGKKGKYYYGKVEAGGITLHKPGIPDFSYCENEYFFIDSEIGLNRKMYYKDKKEILNIVKEYKVVEPYKFFMFSLLR